MSTSQRNYLFPVDMAVALRKLCNDKAMNEASFVRMAVAEKLEDYGIIVDPHLKHGGRRIKRADKPTDKKRGLFGR